MIDSQTYNNLKALDLRLQFTIDQLVIARQSAKNGDKQLLSYVSKKVDQAGKAIGMALERIEG